MLLNNFAQALGDSEIYQADQIDEVIQTVRTNFRFSQVNTKHKYFNVPAALDIETSSFYNSDMEKVGIMYIWMFGIYGKVIIGRTWEELENMTRKLCEILDLGELKRLIVYVHNLSYDFQFFRTHFNFMKVFASDRRKPLYALTDSGIEFRCSYMLSGLSLAKVGENLLKYKMEKKVGDLDYKLIRHQKTKLTRKEIGYCVADVKVVMAYIAEEIERYDGIAKLPLTKTGYVRNYIRHSCFYDPETGRKDKHRYLQFKDLMERLIILDSDMYQHLKNAYAGGFCHGNSIYIKQELNDISSWDFTSSYPACICSERYPMGTPKYYRGDELTQDKFYELIKYYCCVFTIHFYNLREKPEVYENYISESRCIKISMNPAFDSEGNRRKPVVNNGRLVSADYVEIDITEVDFEVIKKFYDWDSFRISNVYAWLRGYLPKDFIIGVLELYKKKTELKGVKGKEAEYMVSKGMLNSCYGMMCTDLVREVNEYNNGWEEPYIPDLDTEIAKYNRKRSRFLYYPWGIYVTAYARKNLFTAILEAGEDYVYSDTDSIKLRNSEAHAEYFESYNKNIINKLEYAISYQGIDLSYIRPKTIKGVEKPLGVWDYEGRFERFKTLGSKRYLVEQNGELELTVSGINKKIAVPYLKKIYKSNDAIFKAFDDGLYIPPGQSGKSTHTYIDYEKQGLVTDYKGVTIPYKEASSIHLEEAPYQLSLSGEFTRFLIQKMKGV